MSVMRKCTFLLRTKSASWRSDSFWSLIVSKNGSRRIVEFSEKSFSFSFSGENNLRDLSIDLHVKDPVRLKQFRWLVVLDGFLDRWRFERNILRLFSFGKLWRQPVDTGDIRIEIVISIQVGKWNRSKFRRIFQPFFAHHCWRNFSEKEKKKW